MCQDLTFLKTYSNLFIYLLMKHFEYSDNSSFKNVVIEHFVLNYELQNITQKILFLNFGAFDTYRK